MSILKASLSSMTGNSVAQQLLEWNVRVSHWLMGVGAGGDVDHSGEGRVLRVLAQRSAPPYCIFDVGANRGQYARLVLDTFNGKQIDLHCFEPAAATFRELSKGLGQRPGVRLNQFALGARLENRELHYDHEGTGLASLTKRRLGHMGIEFDKSEQVRVDTLDDYCAREGVEHIHLLKLDVEGHELDVLAGAAEQFAQRRVDMVAFEFGGCNIDTRSYFQDFHYFFKAHGMSLFRLTPSGYLHPTGEYRELAEQFRTTNFVAVGQPEPRASR